MSTVYMVDARARNVKQAFAAKMETILDAAQLETLVTPGKQQEIVVKTQVGEIGNANYLRPVIGRMVVEKVLSLGSKPLVADSRALGIGPNSGLEWFDVAKMHGFTSAVLGAEVTLADSFTGSEGEPVAAAGRELGFVRVARVVKEARALIVISHVTGHPLTGLAGALTGLGLGCLAAVEGKERVQSILKPRVNAEKCDGCGRCVALCETAAWMVEGENLRLLADRCNGCAVCQAICPPRAIAFDGESIARLQERVAEAATAVVRTLEGRVRYLNFLLDVRPQPDDYPYSDSAFVPDLGILMSDDPVAIDRATLDLITRAPGLPISAAADRDLLQPGREKIGAITGVDPAPLLSRAEELGLGESRYQLLISS